MKLTTQDVIKVIGENELAIRNFGVKEIYLFGSVLRGESKETSDVDFLIVFKDSARVGYFKLIELKMFF